MAERCDYIEINDITKCCGCNNCANICPVNAIKMREDEKGFRYPFVDISKCIHCGLCKTVCPFSEHKISHEPVSAFAVQSIVDENLQRSSSGGVFYELAESVISDGGIVAGCIFNDNMTAEIVCTEDLAVVRRMQGSKYVEAEMNNVCQVVKDILKTGRKVLFSGTPCQVAALRAYVGDTDCNALYTIDFVCHGVPSRKLFKCNTEAIINRYKSDIVEYSFRSKTLGWGQQTLIKFGNAKRKSFYPEIQPYHYGYLRGYLNRDCCYKCPFAVKFRFSDITIGDYWGGQKYHTNFNSVKGLSFLCINTDKGATLFELCKSKFKYEATTVSHIGEENNDIVSVEPRNDIVPNIREDIYSTAYSKGFSYAAKKYLKPKNTIKVIMKRILPTSLISIVKRRNWSND